MHQNQIDMKKQENKANFIWVAGSKLVELFGRKDEEVKQIRLIDDKDNEFIAKDVSDISMSYTKEKNELTIFINTIEMMVKGISG